jgi:SAM-dependent methyltransferase
VIGSVVRRLAGPLEPRLADAYRAFFFDVDDFAGRIAALGEPARIVEIGCGEGALITALARRLPATQFVGVDVQPSVGRLYRGAAQQVEFICGDARDVAVAHEGQADLVIICDVLHHASSDDQAALWHAAGRLVRPDGGRLILKEWIRNPAPIYYLGYFSDRYITGDRIRYESRSHWAEQAERQAWTVEREWSLAPWATNHAYVLARRAAA